LDWIGLDCKGEAAGAKLQLLFTNANGASLKGPGWRACWGALR